MTTSYDIARKDNEGFVRMINAAWGANVAWVEDQETTRTMKDRRGHMVTYKMVIPVIVSRMVGGLVPGLTPPPFKDRLEPRMAA